MRGATALRRLHRLESHMRAAESGNMFLACNSTSALAESAWSAVPQAPPDAILGITEAFKRDNSAEKINLGVGAYRTEEGKPLVLDVVRKAQRMLVDDKSRNLEYLPIGGIPEFCSLSAALAFGKDSRVIQEKRNITVQSLSGTGSLRVGAEFLQKHYPGKKLIYLPRPTWANHQKIFPLAGIEVQQYRYWDAQSCGLDFSGMLEDLQQAPETAIVLLHACAHNPTGVDPTPGQWGQILDIVKQKRLLPFFDSAYQGFASGDLERDAQPFRQFADAGLELLLAQSYAKNMGLYGERVGALTVVTSDQQNAKEVESQLKATIRPFYSSPPRTGAEIVVKILSNPDLYTQWKEELRGMADRIKAMRSQLHGALQEKQAPGNWDHIVNQIGMFSYTGLNKVKHLTEQSHVYLTEDGRISMAGLNSNGCKYLANAIVQALKNT